MTSKSARTDIQRSVLIENEQRHSLANVPMSIPKGSFQVVPGIFVAGKSALPRLIEFFNVTHVVRCLEYEPQEPSPSASIAAAAIQANAGNNDAKKLSKEIASSEDDKTLSNDILVDLGGTLAAPYGSGIPYPKNVFFCPIHDSIDESEFLPWARRASEFIANTLRIEEEEDTALAVAEAKEEGDRESTQQHEDSKNAQDGGDDDGSCGRHEEKKGKMKRTKYNNNNNNDNTNTNSMFTSQQHHVDANNNRMNNNNDDPQQQQQQKQKQEQEQEQEQEERPANDEVCVANDPWAPYRERPPGAVVIHCEKGKSRSPAIAMAYLILKRHMTLQEAMDMFDGDDGDDVDQSATTSATANTKQDCRLQLNPIFVLELAKLEAEVHGRPLFDLDAYWLQRLQQLFPKVPTATIARELAAAGGNMLVAREKLMTVAARQFFDRDGLMIDALHSVVMRTVGDYRAAPNMKIPDTATSEADVVTKAECSKFYFECDKKRDVALMKLTQLAKQRMTIS